MSIRQYLIHERTLLGAFDSYVHALVHAKPYLVNRHEAALDELAEAWLAAGGENALEALDAQWLRTYLADAPARDTLSQALDDFYGWAVRNDLLDQNPLASCVST